MTTTTVMLMKRCKVAFALVLANVGMLNICI